MSNKTEKKISNLEKNPNLKTRRSFIKRSSAGFLISSLPAQSVWGACNASGISGGSRNISNTCYFPNVNGGLSPGFWEKFLDLENWNGNSFQSKFSFYSAASDDDIAKVKCEIASYINSTTVRLSNGAGNIPSALLNLGQALANPGGIWNLAAFYLNAHYGFYTLPPEFSSADELTQHMWGVLYVRNGNEAPTDFDSLTATWSPEGSTSYQIPISSECQSAVAPTDPITADEENPDTGDTGWKRKWR
ncbi:hypothetical protein QX776_05305 [Alteromonadaceae bacterium BrNp21-10]|nr:hypothetical protein [Alteromonadaceae bacterium BrNp21-10]